MCSGWPEPVVAEDCSHDRRDLWCVLFAITKQKVVDQKRYEGCKKRGGGEVRGDSVLNASNGKRNGGRKRK